MSSMDKIRNAIIQRRIMEPNNIQGAEKGGSNIWFYKDLTIDTFHKAVSRSGKSLKLTPTEYTLFETLLHHIGKLCTREDLLRIVWGITEPVRTRTVDVHISRLRRKLHLERDLCTIPRRGYLLLPSAGTPGLP